MILKILRSAAVFFAGCVVFPRLVGAEHPSSAPQPPFHFRQIVLSDSPTRVFLIRLNPHGPPIAVDNLPLLATRDFAAYIAPFIGREITEASLNELVNGITAYVHGKGQPLVNVSLPPQNVSDGHVHIVVVIGRYNLGRLIISNSESKAAHYVPGPNDGQIVVQDDPALATQAFAKAMAPHFGQPITDENVNAIAGDIDAYAVARGQIVADIGVPRQDVSTGALRLSVTLGDFPLRRVVIAETPAEAEATVIPSGAGTVVAPHFPLFESRDFRRLLARYVGKPISRDGVVRLRADISAYVKNHDRIALAVPPPQVDLQGGVLRMSVLIARYGDIQFRGNRWFSSKLLAGSLGFKAGQEIQVSELEAAVNRTNQNPFRHVDVLINGLNAPPTSGDVPIAVTEQETLPLRASVSYDDTGNDLIGNNHYTAAVTVGNLWGWDHQLSYQYTTTDDPKDYSSQVFNYRAPLPWHDYIVAAGAYSAYNVGYGADNVLQLKGDEAVLDGRYVHPIFGDTWSLELSVGFDYKQISTDLEFAGFPYLNTVNSIAQYTSGATYVQHDASGSWIAGFTVNASPGGFNARNTSARFQGNVAPDPTTGQPIGGPEAEARYVYETANVQRVFLLPSDFQLWIRGQGQLASARLLSSERMAIGGEATVRGYNERIMSGDEGWDFSTELRSPAWGWHVPFTPRRYARLENRVLAFFDDGRVDYRHPRPDDSPLSRLTSAGVGLRSSWAANFSLLFDYGWQLKSTGTGAFAQPNRSRAHIQATLSY